MDPIRKVLVLALTASLLVAACGGGDDSGDSGETGGGAAATPAAEGCNTEPQKLDSGLQIKDIKCGTGDEAAKGDTISVHYVGTLENGKKFDSSRDRGTPFDFQLGAGQVIAGWDEGLVGMKIGGLRELTIPPELGYGAAGSPPVIPPNATLIFEVELLDIK